MGLKREKESNSLEYKIINIDIDDRTKKEKKGVLHFLYIRLFLSVKQTYVDNFFLIDLLFPTIVISNNSSNSFDTDFFNIKFCISQVSVYLFTVDNDNIFDDKIN